MASFSIGVCRVVATVIVTWAACAHAGAVTEPSLKGYGIKGVEGATLSDMLARCAVGTSAEASVADGEGPALHAARCAQLRRSLRNQPGNAARAVR